MFYLILLILSFIIDFCIIYKKSMQRMWSLFFSMDFLILLIEVIMHWIFQTQNLLFTFILKCIIFNISFLLINLFSSSFKIKKVSNGVDKKIVFSFIFYTICIFIFTVIVNFIEYYSQVPIEQLAFHLQVPITDAASAVIYDFLKNPLFITGISFTIFIFLLFILKKFGYYQIVYSGKNSFINKKIFTVKLWKFNFIVGMFIALSLIYLTNKIDLKDFIASQFIESNFISEHYSDPENVEIEFPTDKRNLIYIFLESMESSYKDGEANYIPKLISLAEENLDLSVHNGQFYEITGATWTIASMVAQTSGLPLKFSIESETYNGDRKSFLNGVTTLGDILSDQGYNNYFFLGSDAAFAYRNLYFREHGNYEILDYKAAKSEGFISEDYSVFWGYEDKKLYEISKTKLLEISKNDEPFNLTMLTVDTHATDGYLDETCEKVFDTQLENVLYCSDSMIYEFIDWIKKQDFYENTTIVIVGDHFYMANNDILSKNRSVYAAIINPADQKLSSIEREFCAVDMFPTTLEALGAKISDGKLGLGVSLFSENKTLIEQFGYNYVNDELKKKSSFYRNLNLYK